MENLRYKEVNIVLQEIPSEVSLSFTITGCMLNCIGCHSSYLWKKGSGSILTDNLLIDYLLRYKQTISCVLFMGGEWCLDDLLSKIDIIKQHELKVALYTGLNLDEVDSRLLSSLDYIKVGRWVKEYGGLNSANTNQRLIDLSKNVNILMNTK